MVRNLNIGIMVMSDGDRTVAEAVLIDYENIPIDNDDGLVPVISGSGSAGREPGDKSDQSVGDDLALARSLRSLAARLERRANGKVRHAESCKAHRAEIAERKGTGYPRPPEEFDKKALPFDYAGAISKLFDGGGGSLPISPPHDF
jgi:hypothetical protein